MLALLRHIYVIGRANASRVAALQHNIGSIKSAYCASVVYSFYNLVDIANAKRVSCKAWNRQKARPLHL